MELRGNKAITHDFLSLYNDSTTSQDSKPPPQGAEFLLKTHDFLQPLERAEKSGGGGAREPGDATPTRVDIKLSSAPEAATGKPPDPTEAVRHGGFCTYDVGHVTCYNSPARPAVVKPNWFTCPSPAPGGADRKAEYSRPSRVASGAELPAWRGNTTSTGRSDSYSYPAGAVALWEESALHRDGGAHAGRGSQQQRQPRHQHQQRPFPTPLHTICGGSHGSSFCVSLSNRQQMSQDKCPAMASESKSNKGIADEDDEDEDEDEEPVGKKETLSRKELTVKVDGGRNNKTCDDQKTSTPRSKHSETEQRRRSKINDRFRILRDLIPHSDQKRDKASLLFEAIEYVQFLQEKVQKYESSYSGWNQGNTKLMPWVTDYLNTGGEELRYRSFSGKHLCADQSWQAAH